MNVAVVPARSGSVRLADKNVRGFHGRPLIAYSIEAALGSGCFDRVVVTTDSERIAAIAIAHGAEAPFLRTPDLAGDDVPLAPVLLDALERIGGPGQVDLMACIYATAPLLRGADIAEGRDAMTVGSVDAAMSVTSFPYPVHRALTADGGTLRFAWPEHELTRSQDLPELVHDAGQFIWLRPSSFVAQRRLVMETTVPIPIPRELVQDIDTPEDLARAEALFRAAHP